LEGLVHLVLIERLGHAGLRFEIVALCRGHVRLGL